MCNSLIKGKKELKLVFTPTNNLERSFFYELFSGNATIETVPNTDDIIITQKEKQE